MVLFVWLAGAYPDELYIRYMYDVAVAVAVMAMVDLYAALILRLNSSTRGFQMTTPNDKASKMSSCTSALDILNADLDRIKKTNELANPNTQTYVEREIERFRKLTALSEPANIQSRVAEAIHHLRLGDLLHSAPQPETDGTHDEYLAALHRQLENEKKALRETIATEVKRQLAALSEESPKGENSTG